MIEIGTRVRIKHHMPISNELSAVKRNSLGTIKDVNLAPTGETYDIRLDKPNPWLDEWSNVVIAEEVDFEVLDEDTELRWRALFEANKRLAGVNEIVYTFCRIEEIDIIRDETGEVVQIDVPSICALRPHEID